MSTDQTDPLYLGVFDPRRYIAGVLCIGASLHGRRRGVFRVREHEVDGCTLIAVPAVQTPYNPVLELGFAQLGQQAVASRADGSASAWAG